MEVDEEVCKILQAKYEGYDQALAREFTHGGHISVAGKELHANIPLLSDITKLPAEGEIVHQKKHSLQAKMAVILVRKEPMVKTPSKAIAMKYIKAPRGRLALVLLQYLFLDDPMDGVKCFHLAFLNSLR